MIRIAQRDFVGFRYVTLNLEAQLYLALNGVNTGGEWDYLWTADSSEALWNCEHGACVLAFIDSFLSLRAILSHNMPK